MDDFEDIVGESYEYVKPVPKGPISREDADRLAQEFVLGLDPAKKEEGKTDEDEDALAEYVHVLREPNYQVYVKEGDVSQMEWGPNSGTFVDQPEREEDMKEKASATDGLVCLLLFVVSAGLISWACMDFGWDLVRLTGGIISFSILYSFSKRFSKG